MRIKPIAISIIACLVVAACNQHPAVKNNNTGAVVADGVAKELADTPVAVPGMPGYVYNEYGHVYPVGQQNFVDAFGIDGQQFKLTYTYNNSILNNNTKLEQQTDGKWKPLLMFDYGWHSGYSRKDVNGDGYPDFVDEWHYGSNAHFYLPAKKTFDTAVSFELFDWELIDTARNIYCQNKNIKGHQDESILYTFKGVDPIILYTVNFEKDEPVMNALLKAINLYKNVPRFKDSTVLISSTPLNEDKTEFDYDTYWRKNYKELLGFK